MVSLNEDWSFIVGRRVWQNSSVHSGHVDEANRVGARSTMFGQVLSSIEKASENTRSTNAWNCNLALTATTETRSCVFA